MGCSTSVPVSENNRPHSRRKSHMLTEREMVLIERTWRRLADDMTGRGVRIFLEIFRRNPEARRLFPFRDASDADLPNDPKFRGHASRFMQAIGAAVDNIRALDSNLAPLLTDLGRAHSTTGHFDPAYFELFKDVIFATFEEDLGRRLTPEARGAWSWLLGYVMLQLQEGYRQGTEAKGQQ